MIFSLVKEIPYQDPLPIFAMFAATAGAVFLDSANREICGRYSFIAVDPFQILTSKNGEISLRDRATSDEKFSADPFQVLREQLARFPLAVHPDLPPFQGGVAGFLGYELHQHLEKISLSGHDDMQFPDLALGFYDLVMAFDHEVERAWIFSSGYPEVEDVARELRALQRCEWLLSKLFLLTPSSHGLSAGSRMQSESKSLDPADKPRDDGHLVCRAKDIKANFSAESYQAAVSEVIEYILAGDIFEANIAQRFMAPLPDGLTPWQLYQRLRLLNPAPFAAYLSFEDMVIASASPERFLQVRQGQVEARPIKGTRKRGVTAENDRELAQELLQSEKDRAENVMIVDLLRNDLSRVCEDHSVKVSQLCGLESYATVHHLVSVVEGKLREKVDALDLLRAAFPGGSITGAPKVRAMEIIAELEPTQRGPYCGSVIYLGFNGDMDSSIIIRTYAIKNNIVTFQAGGAVVMDSDPLAEYTETLTKAQALRNALMNSTVSHQAQAPLTRRAAHADLSHKGRGESSEQQSKTT